MILVIVLSAWLLECTSLRYISPIVFDDKLINMGDLRHGDQVALLASYFWSPISISGAYPELEPESHIKPEPEPESHSKPELESHSKPEPEQASRTIRSKTKVYVKITLLAQLRAKARARARAKATEMPDLS